MGSRPVHSTASAGRRRRARASLLAALLLAVPLLAIPTTAAADPGAPWDGTPISAGLGPTYGSSAMPQIGQLPGASRTTRSVTLRSPRCRAPRSR